MQRVAGSNPAIPTNLYSCYKINEGDKTLRKYTKEWLEELCKDSTSYAEVLQKAGRKQGGGSQKTLRDKIALFEIDISHFTGQSHSKNRGRRARTIEDYLNNLVQIKSHKLRLRLFEEGIFEKKCYSCGNTEWLGQPIPLELHHIDGNNKNNNLENLMILCPNCHYFTETYKTKNIKRNIPQ